MTDAEIASLKREGRKERGECRDCGKGLEQSRAGKSMCGYCAEMHAHRERRRLRRLRALALAA